RLYPASRSKCSFATRPFGRSPSWTRTTTRRKKTPTGRTTARAHSTTSERTPDGCPAGGPRMAGRFRCFAHPAAWPPRRGTSGGPAYGYGWGLQNGQYGHSGSDGTYAWVDPERGIIALVLTQTPRGRNPITKFRQMVGLAVEDEGQVATQ